MFGKQLDRLIDREDVMRRVLTHRVYSYLDSALKQHHQAVSVADARSTFSSAQFAWKGTAQFRSRESLEIPDVNRGWRMLSRPFFLKFPANLPKGRADPPDSQSPIRRIRITHAADDALVWVGAVKLRGSCQSP